VAAFLAFRIRYGPSKNPQVQMGPSFIRRYRSVAIISIMSCIQMSCQVRYMSCLNWINMDWHQEETFDQIMIVRKAIEDAKIPFTYVSANCFAGYFVGSSLLRPQPLQKMKFVFMGMHGHVKDTQVVVRRKKTLNSLLLQFILNYRCCFFLFSCLHG